MTLRNLTRLLLIAVCTIASASLAWGALYPTPGPVSAAPIVCSNCSGSNYYGEVNAGLPTWSYAPNLKSFVGRYLDSTEPPDVQNEGMRTLRTFKVMAAPSRNRLYMILGSTLAAYRLDTFFTGQLGGGLVSVTQYDTGGTYNRKGSPPERVLPFGQWFYAEGRSSGWRQQSNQDGGQKFYDFDFDDRGYVYVGYDGLGWGIVRDDGNTSGTPMTVLFNGLPKNTTVVQSITSIMSLKVDGRYYALISDEFASGTEVYDVTSPGSPDLVATINGRGFKFWAKNTVGDRVAVIDNSDNVKIFASSRKIASGTNPVAEFEKGTDKFFVRVASDGTNFWAIEQASSGYADVTLWSFSPSGDTYVARSFPLGKFETTSLHARDGYVSIAGFSEMPGIGWLASGRVFNVNEDGSLAEVALGDFFTRYYSYSPSGYAMPPLTRTSTVTYLMPFRQGAKVYLVSGVRALGDVFEIQQPGPAVTLDTIAPASGPAIGGSRVTLSGTNFATAGTVPRVTFGGVAATIDASSSTATTLAVTTPPHAKGTVDVVVINPNGQQATLPGGFKYSDCIYTLSPIGATFGAGAVTGASLKVTTTSGCTWNATAPAGSFVTVTANSSGSGNLTVTYDVAQNTTAEARTTTLNVAGRDVTILQTAAGVAPIVLHANASLVQVALDWSETPDANKYDVWRSSAGGPFTFVTTTSDLTYLDGAASPGKGYLYRVSGRHGDATISASNVDLAVPFSYTDSFLLPGSRIRAEHFDELRQAVNLAREAVGWRPTVFTSTTSPFLLRTHLTELRTNVSAVRAAVGLSGPNYQNPTVVVGQTTVKAVHVQELRVGLQ